MSVPRAAIYTRISTDEQTGNYSLPTQEHACRQYCEQRGYDVVGVFVDVFSGALYRERPGLTQLRELVRQGLVDVVVCYAVDRLSRSQTHLFILVEEFSERGCRLEFVTERFEDTAVGRFVLAARSFAAELEREKIVERTIRGTYARVRSGKPKPAVRPPYGYRWVDAEKSRMEPDPDEAPVVRRIFERLANGATIRSVAQELQARGIPTPLRSKMWSTRTIHAIAHNPVYIGKYYGLRTKTVRENGRTMIKRLDPTEWVLLPDVAPPLVDEETWQRVQERLLRNKEDAARNLKYAPDALLRGGFVRCGTCGRSMVVHTARQTMPRYRCCAEVDSRCPAPATVAIDRLDRIVRQWVAEVLSRPEVLVRAAEAMESDPAMQQVDSELSAMQRRKAELERRRQNYLTASARRTTRRCDKSY